MCETMIGGEGINISIENTDGFIAFQKEAIGILLDSSNFTLTWDNMVLWKMKYKGR